MRTLSVRPAWTTAMNRHGMLVTCWSISLGAATTLAETAPVSSWSIFNCNRLRPNVTFRLTGVLLSSIVCETQRQSVSKHRPVMAPRWPYDGLIARTETDPS